MAYDERLADRVREIISEKESVIEEKKMFGGLCFMVNEKMCIGVEKDRMMLRTDPQRFDELVEMEGCKPMDFTGKVMKGFLFVNADTLTTKKKLEYWVQMALDYNKIAKPSRKKKKEKK